MIGGEPGPDSFAMTLVKENTGAPLDSGVAPQGYGTHVPQSRYT